MKTPFDKGLYERMKGNYSTARRRALTTQVALQGGSMLLSFLSQQWENKKRGDATRSLLAAFGAGDQSTGGGDREWDSEPSRTPDDSMSMFPTGATLARTSGGGGGGGFDPSKLTPDAMEMYGPQLLQGMLQSRAEKSRLAHDRSMFEAQATLQRELADKADQRQAAHDMAYYNATVGGKIVSEGFDTWREKLKADRERASLVPLQVPDAAQGVMGKEIRVPPNQIAENVNAIANLTGSKSGGVSPKATPQEVAAWKSMFSELTGKELPDELVGRILEQDKSATSAPVDAALRDAAALRGFEMDTTKSLAAAEAGKLGKKMTEEEIAASVQRYVELLKKGRSQGVEAPATAPAQSGAGAQFQPSPAEWGPSISGPAQASQTITPEERQKLYKGAARLGRTSQEVDAEIEANPAGIRAALDQARSRNAPASQPGQPGPAMPVQPGMQQQGARKPVPPEYKAKYDAIQDPKERARILYQLNQSGYDVSAFE